MSSRRTILFAVIATCTACVGTEIGNPPSVEQTTVSVDLLAVEETPPMTIPIGLTVSDQIEVDRAALLVGDLRFRQLETCADAGADHTDGFLAELLDATVDIEDIDLPSGTYCRLDIRPRRGGEDGFLSEYPELDGLTAYATGTYQGTPFELRYDSDDELSFRGEFELPPGRQTLFVVVDIPAWFDGLDLSSATLTDGRIIIAEEENPALAEIFENKFRASISVALDANGDAVLTAEDHEEEEEEP